MRIKEFFIKRYGPLRDRSYALSGSFNLFFGKNEEGKTLTIDALVKLLLGRNIKDFERIDRVEEIPEGYLIVENDEGREVKMPEKGNLTILAHLNPSECRNLFIIRNSDLSIVPENEFYTSVTDQLMGVRTEEISKIKETLREMARITPSGSFRDMKEEKLKTRIEQSSGLISRIESLVLEVKEGQFDRLEEELAGCQDERDRIIQEIGDLEGARKREKYEGGRQALTKLRASLGKLEEMEVYTAEKAQLWRDCERDIQRLGEEKNRLETDVEGLRTELKATSERLNDRERDLRILEETKTILDQEVRQELSVYERDRQKLELQDQRSRLLSWTWMVCAGLLGICLVGIMLRPFPVFFILGGLFLAATVFCWILKYRFVRCKASLENVFERIRLILSKWKLDAESIEGILSKIQKFDTEYQSKNEELQDTKRKKETIEERIRELRESVIPEVEKKFKGAGDQIDEIMIKSKQTLLGAYMKKLRLKEELKKTIGETQSVLKSHFGEPSGQLDQNVEHWEKEIAALEIHRDESVDVKYSEEAMSKLEKKKREIDERLEEMNRKVGSFQKEMAEIERRVNEILRSKEEYMYCRTSVDLEAVKKELQRFIDDNETNRDNVLRALEIFEEIEVEEREKISELFDPLSPISEYFSGITGGLYKEVTLNHESGEIEVTRRDGNRLGAEKLSGGAFDQLYLSIRLALGKKLLKGERGFFIMDDPFIKADPDRLRRQLEILKGISESGWQIMYFSAKEEVQNALAGDIKKGIVNPIEIQGLAS